MAYPFVASFLGTAVEYIETMAIMYAILRAGYPREAILATVTGHTVIFACGFALWPVHDLIPVLWFRLAAACILTSMGLYWIVKSIKRIIAHKRPRWVTDPLGKVGLEAPENARGSATTVSVEDEAKSTSIALRAAFSWFVFAVMLKSALVEAFEILLVVFPLGAASHAWAQVLGGAALAIAVVTTLVFLLHGQLKRIPEVKVKLVSGVVLAGIGVWWLIDLVLDRV